MIFRSIVGKFTFNSRRLEPLGFELWATGGGLETRDEKFREPRGIDKNLLAVGDALQHHGPRYLKMWYKIMRFFGGWNSRGYGLITD